MTATVNYRPRDWDTQPPLIFPGYKSTVLRGPTKPLVPLSQSLSERSGPVYGHDDIAPGDNDLTKNGVSNGEPLGQRIIVAGRIVDENDRPVPDTLVEIWQANASGRYIHRNDQHDAPLDPNFVGGGRAVTDADGNYRFITIQPAAYCWNNHPNAWRPAHIHFSLFGPSFATRLITQMYFPGDPLIPHDPMCMSAPEAVRDTLVSQFSFDLTEPEWALGYAYDIVVRGLED